MFDSDHGPRWRARRAEEHLPARRGRPAWLLAVGIIVAACATAPVTPAPTVAPVTAPPTTAPSPSPTRASTTIGVVALGHSGINGEGNLSGKDVSWATGRVGSVRSVYARLTELRPETNGHVANAAVSGSTAADLPVQATAALGEVPTPELVVIYTLENDVRCDSTEAPHVTAYGDALRQGLVAVTTASPESRILIVSSFGRPASYARLFDQRPDVRRLLGGGGRCDMWDRSGDLVPENVTRLTTTLEQYEAEMARVCAEVPQCHTDEGLFTTYEDAFEDLVQDDWGHLNARGHAKLAELIWPRVLEILGLDDSA